MSSKFNDISFIQINRRLEDLRKFKHKSVVRDGWIKFMRKAFGLSAEALSKLSDASKSAINQAERREKEGKINLETLKKYAEAMDCELVYYFLPKDELKTLIKNKAYTKARTSLLSADLHMKLEDQKVEGDINEQIESLAMKLIEKGDIW
jgi:predicted DNA-binding mobile mystery protein A